MLSRIVRNLLLASVACMAADAALLPAAAVAADLAPVTKAPVLAVAPAPSWTGFYVGGNVGYGWDSGSVGTPVTTTDPALAGFLAATLAAGSYPAALSPSAKGVIGGGQIGYNWQVSSQWLVGLETDLQASGLKGTTSQTQFPVGFSVTSTEVSKSLSWFGTVRGRVGFLATSQWLLYATGGLAYGETKLDFNTVDQTLGCIPGIAICAAGSSSGVRVGWTAGGGVEAMIAPDWSVKAEYLYVDLGRRTMTIPSITPAIVFTPSTQFHEQIARAGINYHFNWGGPVVARY